MQHFDPTFYDLAIVEATIARVEAVLDHAIAVVYGPQSVQHQELLRRYPGANLHEETHSTVVAAEDRVAGLRDESHQAGHIPALDQLLEDAEVEGVEREIFLLAMAAALDAGIRKRIALYKDNILQSFVDVDLALQLFVGERIERLASRDVFAPSGRLLKAKLVELTLPKDALTTEYLLVFEVRVPSRVLSYVLGRESLDEAVAAYSRFTIPAVAMDQVVLPPEDLESVLGLLEHYATYRDDASQAGMGDILPVGRSLVLQFSGAPGTGKSLLVRALTTHLGRRLLTVDCDKLASEERQFADKIDRIFFEARQRGAVLALESAEAVFSAKNPRAATVFRHLEDHDGIVVIVTHDTQGLDFALERWVAFHLKLEVPAPELREEIWRVHMPSRASLGPDVDIPALAHQFEFTGGQIRNAVLIAMNRSLARSGRILLDQVLLDHSAQAQLRADMDELSHKSHVKLTLDHLVLPKDELALVREVLNAAKVRNYVMTHWGFGRRLTTGKGLVALFGGEPGTGKTLAAEIIASELHMPLYRVSVPRVMSKWVGETEKNIEKIFTKARASHSVLLFDEADSLFTSRVKVENSVDRFANMETNLLLQEIERFEGLCILTTNHEKNIDDAFQRRIQFKIDFPFPEPDQRALIWRTLIPKECPIEDDIDYELLGKNFELSGGYIKNAIVRAAYRAAVAGRPISMRDIEDSAEQECKNAGKIFRSLSPRDDRPF